jgi:hypothetical protein
MWIVKRMSTAPIVVLTIAFSAGGAAYLASRSDSRPLPTETVSQLQGMNAPGQSDAHQAGTLSLALESKSSKGRTI